MDDKLINVLLVENEASTCEFIKQALSDCSKTVSFAAQTAKNLSEALELLKQKEPDIILSDLDLPDSSGIETIKKIRSLNPYIPIIVMTELADEEFGVQTIKNGADDYLTKGKIFRDVLGRSIRYAIERKKERHSSEKALLNEKNKAQKYLDVAQVILVVLNTDQKVTLINRKGCEILGCSEKEIIGKDWCDNFVPDRIREKVRAAIAKVLKGKIEPAEYFENHILTRNGDERIVAWRNTILYDNQGRIEAMLNSGEDITERRTAEEQKTKLLEEVKNANQELKDFAYVVSHDLKAPLRGIKTLANWIMDDYGDKFDENGKEQMNLLLARVGRMHNLIDGVLQYSRVGRIKEEKVEVNLNKLLSEVIDTLAPPQNITITVEDELPSLQCERTRITQVFQNLLSNAVKYMDKPQGQIKLGCSENNGFWQFSVTDNGPGIEEKHFERIFQIFQTLAPRDEFESTGVGLTVAKKIVELYGGKIWVESKVGEGSTFFFTLPRQEKDHLNERLKSYTAC